MPQPIEIPLVEPPASVKAGARPKRPFAPQWAAWIGTEHAAAFADARAAWRALFAALDLQRGDKVLLSSCATAPLWDALRDAGLEPVLVEPDRYTLNLRGSEIPPACWGTLGAVVVTHLYGRPAHLDMVVAEARKFGVPVLEDALQAHGAEYRGKRVGGFGDAAVFCFRPCRVLGDEEGGAAVVTSDAPLAEALAAQAEPERLEGAVGARLEARLARLEAHLADREALADAYRALLGDLEGLRAVLPERQGRHVYYRFVIRVGDADGMRDLLAAEGIQTGRPAFRALESGRSLPVTEAAAHDILYLPMALSLGEAGVERVCAALRRNLLTGR